MTFCRKQMHSYLQCQKSNLRRYLFIYQKPLKIDILYSIRMFHCSLKHDNTLQWHRCQLWKWPRRFKIKCEVLKSHFPGPAKLEVYGMFFLVKMWKWEWSVFMSSCNWFVPYNIKMKKSLDNYFSESNFWNNLCSLALIHRLTVIFLSYLLWHSRFSRDRFPK